MSNTYNMRAIPLEVTASTTSGSQTPELAFDGNTGSYWRPATPAGSWLQAKIKPAAITRLRWYQGSTSYRVVDFTLSGSDDGEAFASLYTGTLASATGWYEFDIPNATPYTYYRITVDTYSNRPYIYELELWHTVPFAKPDGKYLWLTFTEDLTGDVTGLAPPVGYSYKTPTGLTVSSQYNATYSADKMADGDTATYWWTTAAVGSWIQAEVNGVMTGFRWYIGNTSYRPINFTVSGGDGDTFTDLYTADSPNAIGWHEFGFVNTQAFAYYRITINTANSSYLYIHELELYLPHGNEAAFTVTVPEWTMTPQGEPIQVARPVESVQRHPTKPRGLLLTMPDFDRVHNADGNITVSYDMSKGNLMGLGGPVESFTRDFAPQDLVMKPNPHDAENIELTTATAQGTLMRIYYTNTKADEHITIANVTATGVLTHINDV